MLRKLNTHVNLVIIKSYTIRKTRFELRLMSCSLLYLICCLNCIIVVNYLGRQWQPVHFHKLKFEWHKIRTYPDFIPKIAGASPSYVIKKLHSNSNSLIYNFNYFTCPLVAMLISKGSWVRDDKNFSSSSPAFGWISFGRRKFWLTHNTTFKWSQI